MKRAFFVISIFIIFLVCGCTLAPKYERPESPVPAKWPTGPAYREMQASSPASQATDLSWQEFVTDARLRQIIETALSQTAVCG